MNSPPSRERSWWSSYCSLRSSSDAFTPVESRETASGPGEPVIIDAVARTALVTGGAGFVGSNLVRALLDRGDTVRVLDNFSTGNRANLVDLAGEVEVVEGDLRSYE